MISTILGLRAFAMLFNLRGETKLAKAFGTLADGVSAGLNVDHHMQLVADKLKAGEQIDTEDLIARIKAEQAALHDQDPPAPVDR